MVTESGCVDWVKVDRAKERICKRRNCRKC